MSIYGQDKKVILGKSPILISPRISLSLIFETSVRTHLNVFSIQILAEFQPETNQQRKDRNYYHCLQVLLFLLLYKQQSLSQRWLPLSIEFGASSKAISSHQIIDFTRLRNDHRVIYFKNISKLYNIGLFCIIEKKTEYLIWASYEYHML